MDRNNKIVVENLYKIFGPEPDRAIALIKEGLSKEEILEKTGMTVGVDNASFSVETGEIFVVMGLSGSGKSTLVRMLNRLIEPSGGKVLVNGRDIVSMGEEELVDVRRKTLAMVFQSFALMPHLNIVDNVAFGLQIAGMDVGESRERAMEALEQVGLSAWSESMPDELSGGMQQRVGLARALAVDPDVLLMDEAFSALDPLIRSEMQDELLKLQARHKRTIIFISHDLDEAMRIGDRIAIMEGGRVVQVGSPEEILQNPANDYVKAFFRGVDPTNILSAGDIARNTQTTIIRHPGHGPRTALELLGSSDRDFGYVLDTEKRFVGLVSSDSLKAHLGNGGKANADLTKAFLQEATPVEETDSLQEILPEVAARSWPIPVIDNQGVYRGVISKNIFLKTLHRDEGDSPG